MFDFYPWVSPDLQIWHYVIVLLTMIYMMYKYRKGLFYIYVIILFYPALFLFLGKNIFNIIQIIILFFTIWLTLKNNVFSIFTSRDSILTILFGLFSLFFLGSSLFHNDSVTIIFSQYARYIEIYLLWFIVRKYIYSKNINKIVSFTFDIILMQIIISIGKFIIFRGQQIESLVGTISHIGGALGTSLPILGFIVLWFYRKGKFQLKDWFFVLGLMLIGFTTGKRAIWFIMPLTIAAFLLYIPRIKLNKALWIAVFMIPFAIYLGFRLTPTLNPENKVGGSFDWEYAIDYASKYQFGDEERETESNIIAQGRGNATLWLLENFFKNNDNLTERDWWGSGLEAFYSTDYEEFKELGYGLAYKGAATGIFQTYVTTGYWGVGTTVLFFFYMLWQFRLKRLRFVMIIIVAWEYFMYTGIIFRTQALMFLIIYFIHYSNFLYWKTNEKKK